MEMIEVEDFVHSGIFKNRDEVIRNALRHLTRAHPEYRIRLAVYRYQKGGISIGKAAELAGVSFEQMKKILTQNSIRPAMGPETIDEAKQEYEILKKHLTA